MSGVLNDVQQIYTDNPGGLPAQYDLASDISVQSIVARIDGSGAAGSFLPTLSLYSQDGKLIVRVPSDVTYAIGDTGVVSWSPFLARRVSTVTPAAGATDFAQTIVSVTTSGGGLTAATIAAWSGVASTTVFGASAGNNPLLLATGLYAIYVALRGTATNPNVDTTQQVQLDKISAGGNATWSSKEPVAAVLGFAEGIIRVNQAGTGISINGFQQPALAALVLVTALPVGGYEFDVTVDQLEDNVSKVATFSVVLTGMYFGPPPV